MYEYNENMGPSSSYKRGEVKVIAYTVSQIIIHSFGWLCVTGIGF